MNKKPLETLRWIGSLPAAIGSAVLVAFPIHWAVMIIHSTADRDEPHMLAAIPPNVLEYFGYAIFTPLTMIYVGAKVAPKFKFETGIALAVLWGILFGVAITLGISRGMFEAYGWLRFTITIVLGIAGVVVGLYQARKTQKEHG